jgi:hypothetical protein
VPLCLSIYLSLSLDLSLVRRRPRALKACRRISLSTPSISLSFMYPRHAPRRRRRRGRDQGALSLQGAEERPTGALCELECALSRPGSALFAAAASQVSVRGAHALTRTHAHSHTRTRTHAHTHTRAHAHTHTRAHAHTRTRTHTHTHTHRPRRPPAPCSIPQGYRPSE